MLVHSCVPNYRVSEVTQQLDTYLHNPEPPQDLIQIGDHACIFDGPWWGLVGKIIWIDLPILWVVSYPWHPNGPRHTLVVSSDSPDSSEQSPTTPDPRPNLSDLRICIPESPAVSPDPCTLSPISIQCNRPFPTPTTSPKPVRRFLVMLTLSDLVFCPIGPRSLPHASGSFPAPSPTLSDQYLAQTTSLKPYGPSLVFLTYADLPEPVSLS